MKARPTTESLALQAEADVPCGPMHTPDDMFNDTHLQAVGMFPEVTHPTEGQLRHIKVPLKFSKTPGGLRRHAERLGGSSTAVLRELGYTAEQIAALEQHGITMT
jgi:formyl-CoA transferase